MYIEEQHVDMQKMLDPKARWPKGGSLAHGRTTFGLDLLEAAKVVTIEDHALRPDISVVSCTFSNHVIRNQKLSYSQVLGRLRPLAEQIRTEQGRKQVHD